MEPISVAAYCRVSTDKSDQINSFQSQKSYFQRSVEANPAWMLYKIYADEGITGTSTKRRAAFNDMIHDAEQGRFRLIVTKEVSRFSRNLLDTVAYTRRLKRLGVAVLFLADGIDTRQPDAELRLSIMGSIAQEESRKTSCRVKWGQTRRMEQGVVFGHELLGYTLRGGVLTPEPRGAAVVRSVFEQYALVGKSAAAIAQELNERGVQQKSGKPWSASRIVKLLKNEKYAGDLVQKKTLTVDYLTHEKRVNRGQEELVILRDHHEPIISRELWTAAQTRLKKRRKSGPLKKGPDEEDIG